MNWGGRREGAGRKPVGRRSGVVHRSRPELGRRLPIHVTMRTASNVYNLRSQRSFNCFRGALKHGADRFGVRVVHFSVQGNHVHLIVEAGDTASLYRAMKGLAVRFARRMNAMMGRKGRVMGDRYHSNVLRTWRAAHNAVAYVRHNHRKHMAQVGEILAATWVDPFSSFAGHVALPAPRTRALNAPPSRGVLESTTPPHAPTDATSHSSLTSRR